MPKPITVTVTEDGKVAIPQVEMTSQGANTNGLDAYRQQDAGLSCYLTGGSYITSGYRENVDYNPIVNLKTAAWQDIGFWISARVPDRTIRCSLHSRSSRLVRPVRSMFILIRTIRRANRSAVWKLPARLASMPRLQPICGCSRQARSLLGNPF